MSRITTNENKRENGYIMRQIQFTCDNCGKESTDIKTWWVIAATGSADKFYVTQCASDSTNGSHVCSQECALQVMREYMDQAIANRVAGKLTGEETAKGDATTIFDPELVRKIQDIQKKQVEAQKQAVVEVQKYAEIRQGLGGRTS